MSIRHSHFCVFDKNPARKLYNLQISPAAAVRTRTAKKACHLQPADAILFPRLQIIPARIKINAVLHLCADMPAAFSKKVSFLIRQSIVF